MKEQTKISIPKGKVPIMEQIENEVVITWKEKEYSYNEIAEALQKDFHNGYIENLLSIGGFAATVSSDSSDTNIFYKKVEVLHKLINVRNYFGKPENEEWFIVPDSSLSNFRAYKKVNPQFILHYAVVFFDSREHAEQAIKILGKELKYLFEPW